MPRPPEVSAIEDNELGLHVALAAGRMHSHGQNCSSSSRLRTARGRRWSTFIDVARDLDVDRDAMLAALDEWGVVYSNGSDIRYGERQWVRLPGITYNAEDRSAELARATRFSVVALGGRPIRSRGLVEAAGRLEVRARSVQPALAALGASEAYAAGRYQG